MLNKKMIETMMNNKAIAENQTMYKFHVLKMYGNKIEIKWDYLDTIFVIKSENDEFDGEIIKMVFWYDKQWEKYDEKHGVTFVGNDKYLCDYKVIDEKMMNDFINKMVYTICNTY